MKLLAVGVLFTGVLVWLSYIQVNPQRAYIKCMDEHRPVAECNQEYRR